MACADHHRRKSCTTLGTYRDSILGLHIQKWSTELSGSEENQTLRGSVLVVDSTGVGAPVVDMMEKEGLCPYAISIHGGDAVGSEGRKYRVPKRDLVSTLQVLLQTQRLKVAEGIKDAQLLVEELLNFRIKISASGHDSYEHWRESAHDDLVLAVALACWMAENMREPRLRWI